MSEAASETSCDWTVTGMDCGSCATKIKDAVTRLPGVSGVEVGIMSERLRLTLDEAQTGRDCSRFEQKRCATRVFVSSRRRQ